MRKEIITNLDELKNHTEVVEIKSGDVELKDKATAIMQDLEDTLVATDGLLALSAPQIGINARVIAMKFNESIKFFINPVVTKKLEYSIGGETCASMPGKEILIARPEKVRLVYYNNKLEYEDNQLLGAAAKLFDQQYQLLEGVTPDELGLVSDIVEDGPLSELSEEEFSQILDIYKSFVKTKTDKLKEEVETDEDLKKDYKKLSFAEDVMAERAAVVEDPTERINANKRRARAKMLIGKNIMDEQRHANQIQLNKFLKKIGK